MKVKNVSRQPLCLQGKTGGIHLMPGEVRTVKEGELGHRQTQTLVKQGLLQVIAAPSEGSGTKQKKTTTNPEPGTQNPELADQREATHG